MQKNMTKGNPLPIILQFTLPLMIGNVFQQIYNAVDSMIVGRFVGANALAAVGSTGTIMFMVIGASTGLSTGFTVLTALDSADHWNDIVILIVYEEGSDLNEYAGGYFCGCI